jgi:signal peptidase II
MRSIPGWSAGRQRDLSAGGNSVIYRHRFGVGLAAALAVFVADQASKYWVLHVLNLQDIGQVVLLPVLNLTMVWNRGVTFGLLNGFGQWGTAALVVIALAVVVALALWLRKASSALMAVSIGAIAGGAVGNVLDRLRYGAVVDFIHAHIGAWSWYVFNVADAAIVCGVGALLLDSVLTGRGTGKTRLADVSIRD